MIEAAAPVRRKKWFERSNSEQTMTFKFVLTPRSKAKKVPPPADEYGRVLDSSTPAEAPAPSHGVSHGKSTLARTTNSAASGSSKPPSLAAVAPAQGVSLADLAGDPAALQRLLACTMFLMSDVPDKDAAPKRLDLDLLPGRGAPGSFAMKHEKKTDHEKGQMKSETKRVMWKISVR
jgi:hypothetical protein